MSSGDHAEKLRELISKLEGSLKPAHAAPAGCPDSTEPSTHLLVYSFMLWESEPGEAAEALCRLYEQIIDPNELRVSLPEEIAEWCGDASDPLCLERAARMRACLNDIYRREHGVTLARLESLPKREVREYLDALEGMTPFVAARVALLGFGGHALPLDQRLMAMLEAQGAVCPGVGLAEAERWLERQVRASEADQVVRLLETWREKGPRRPAKAGGKKPAKRKRPPSRASGGETGKPGASRRPKKDS